jgi:hypothetical protein
MRQLEPIKVKKGASTVRQRSANMEQQQIGRPAAKHAESGQRDE